MHAVVVRRELLSSRHPSNIPPFCKIGGQNRKIQCALINQGFSQKATSKTLKILTFLCLFSSPERRSIRRCTEFHLKLKIHCAKLYCAKLLCAKIILRSVALCSCTKSHEYKRKKARQAPRPEKLGARSVCRAIFISNRFKLFLSLPVDQSIISP